MDRLDRIEHILERIGKELDRTIKETEELKESQKKTDEQLKKTDEQLKKTDEQLKKTDEQLKKTDEQLQKASKRLDNVGKMVGDLTDGWGKFVVGLTEPSVKGCFEKLGFKVLDIIPSSRRRMNGKETEIDLLIPTRFQEKTVIVVVEVKSAINQRKIDDFRKKMENFREIFPEYKDIELVGAMGGVRLAPGTEKIILEEGFYLLTTAKGIMKNKTPVGFKPRIWR
ncbi:MAG: hypothetical protein AB1797_09550 [bacterium]